MKLTQFWFFVLGGLACFAAAAVFAKLNIVVIREPYEVGSGPGAVRDWAPDVTNAGASAGFAIAGGLCMIAAVLAGQRGGSSLPPLFSDRSSGGEQ